MRQKMRLQSQIDRIAVLVLRASMEMDRCGGTKTWRQCIDSISSASEDVKSIVHLLMFGGPFDAAAWAERHATEKQLGMFK